LGGEGGKVGGDDDGGDVAAGDVGAAGVDAQPLQHRLQALLGAGCVAQAVSGAVEAYDQAVADQHVVAHALDVGDVLDARGGAGAGRGEGGQTQD
jgi:hypothetical protein